MLHHRQMPKSWDRFLDCELIYRDLFLIFQPKQPFLRELLRKNQHFIWTENQQKAFDVFKTELTSSSVLQFYDPNKKCTIVTDALNDAIGGILLQSDESGF